MKRITELRQELNITQKMLAEELGVSQRAISHWENGNSEPSIEIIIALTKKFSVSSDYLLEISDEIAFQQDAQTYQPGDNITAEMLKNWSKLNINEKHMVLGFICATLKNQ
ncbi:MAG: helix-turn-helix transcriptional regulator [Bacillota bacterium]